MGGRRQQLSEQKQTLKKEQESLVVFFFFFLLREHRKMQRASRPSLHRNLVLALAHCRYATGRKTTTKKSIYEGLPLQWILCAQ